jgi:hypothetical protein
VEELEPTEDVWITVLPAQRTSMFVSGRVEQTWITKIDGTALVIVTIKVYRHGFWRGMITFNAGKNSGAKMYSFPKQADAVAWIRGKWIADLARDWHELTSKCPFSPDPE